MTVKVGIETFSKETISSEPVTFTDCDGYSVELSVTQVRSNVDPSYLTIRFGGQQMLITDGDFSTGETEEIAETLADMIKAVVNQQSKLKAPRSAAAK